MVLNDASLLPRAAEEKPSSFAAYLLTESLLQWRTFVHMVSVSDTTSVHPCAHSAVRVGFFAPFLLTAA